MTGSALERIITVLEQQGHRVRREGRLRARTTCTHPGADNPTGLGLFDNGSRVQLTCFTHGCDGKEIVESLGLLRVAVSRAGCTYETVINGFVIAETAELRPLHRLVGGDVL